MHIVDCLFLAIIQVVFCSLVPVQVSAELEQPITCFLHYMSCGLVTTRKPLMVTSHCLNFFRVSFLLLLNRSVWWRVVTVPSTAWPRTYFCSANETRDRRM